jgi:23S rRNA (adenine2503-C2)-methyltransferase
VEKVTAKDGKTKFLLRLNDGNLIECVLLLQDYGNTVCVSSQVGCKMKCAFCTSGAHGFVRNLSMEEMLVQILIARKCAKEMNIPNHDVSHLVVMGVGEPFDNFDNLIEFLRAVDIGARKISVSTCGLPDKIREFADLGMQVNLCISLHAPNDFVRSKIMPIAKTHKLSAVLSAAKYFFEKTHRRVIFEYALIEKINSLPEHARELAQTLRDLKISLHVNLIKCNGGQGLNAPSTENCKVFMDTLIKSGVSCTMRKGKGQDIQGACGQLRSASGRGDPCTAEAALARNNFTITASLDPAIVDNNLEKYLDAVNTTPNLDIHLDLMRENMVGHNHCTREQFDFILKNAKKPVDVHFLGTDPNCIAKGARKVFRHDENMIAYTSDKSAVIMMSVIPGASGNPFKPDAVERIAEFKKAHPNIEITVDGGINDKNIAAVKKAGADRVVIGSYLYSIYKQSGQERLSQEVARLLDIARK